MKVGSLIQKLITSCSNEKAMEKGDKENEAQPSQSNGMVKLEPNREKIRQQHKTFPSEAPRSRHPSHFKTAPAETVDHDSPPVSPVSPAAQNMMARKPARPFKRTPTIELEENPLYKPQGGSDYIKILAKYNLFDKDDRNGRVVCRFVNAGNIKNRQPQIVKVEEFSAQGNQEFLANITVGNCNPPQGIPYSPLLTNSQFSRLTWTPVRQTFGSFQLC
jgi:hypothetical protein